MTLAQGRDSRSIWALTAFALMAVAAAADTREIAIVSCAACHGVDGIAPDSEVPHLAGQNERYLLNQLLAFRAGRRPHREMRHMARDLTTAEMAALAAYYASLPPR